MSVSPFPQNVIAVIWDFDRTLLPGYMQDPLFERFGVDGGQFWKEVNALPDFYGKHGHPFVSADTIYLSHILTYVHEGKFGGLNNALLRELGGKLEFYPGLPDFFPTLKSSVEEDDRFRKYDIKVEHYVVSTGLRQTILGSGIAPYVEEVWACEFLELTAPAGFLDGAEPQSQTPPVIRSVGYAIDNTTKTRAVFEINKGVRQHQEITVNTAIAKENRRVPFENMIYIADGPSDVPVFSILNQNGGKTYAVYDPDSEKQFRQVVGLQDAERVQGLGEADYRPGEQTHRWLKYWTEQIALRIAERQSEARRESLLGEAPRHVVESAAEAPQDQAEQKIQATAGAPSDGGTGSGETVEAKSEDDAPQKKAPNLRPAS